MSWSYIVTDSLSVELTQEQKQGNTVEFYNYFKNMMTLEAICGILGNIQQESDMNPGKMEEGYGYDPAYGKGLIQWTPYPSTNPNPLFQWAAANGYDWYDGARQCEYINAEGYFTNQTSGALDEKVWYPTGSWQYSWDEFKAITDVHTAVEAYLYERERAGVAQLNNRLNYADAWYTYLSGIITPFTPRTSLSYPPPIPWYTAPGNWFAANGYGPSYPNGNCTWYAYGRYAEVRNAFSDLPHGDAGTWYDAATAFNRGDFSLGAQPQLGAIVCFRDATDPVNHPGHLTVVEQINNDGTIVVSQSGYTQGGGNTYFWTATVSRDNQYRESWYTQDGRNYYCQGFIYNDNVVPPVPPTPVYTKRKMPLWMMLRWHR